jgi:hypothetical protein
MPCESIEDTRQVAGSMAGGRRIAVLPFHKKTFVMQNSNQHPHQSTESKKEDKSADQSRKEQQHNDNEDQQRIDQQRKGHDHQAASGKVQHDQDPKKEQAFKNSSPDHQTGDHMTGNHPTGAKNSHEQEQKKQGSNQQQQSKKDKDKKDDPTSHKGGSGQRQDNK